VRNLETLYGNDVNAIDVVWPNKPAYHGSVDRVVFYLPRHTRFNLTPMPERAISTKVWAVWLGVWWGWRCR